MKTIYVKTVNTCNLNCGHCFTSGRNGDKSRWDPPVTLAWIKDFISKSSNDVHHHIELHGGEPFLVPLEEIESFTAEVKTYGDVSVSATTNLVYPIGDRFIDLVVNGFESRIGTSWDPDIRFERDSQRDRWLKNVTMLSNAGVSIKLMVSLSRELIERGPQYLLDQLDTFPVEDVALERITVDGSTTVNTSILPDNEKQDKYLLQLYKLYRSKVRNYKIVTYDILEQRIAAGVVKADTHCRNCEQNLVTMNADGTLSGCPNTAASRLHAHMDDGVEAYLQSDGRINQIVEELTHDPRCLRCDVFDVCGGDCHKLPWTGNRCGGMKYLLRHLTGRETINIINLT